MGAIARYLIFCDPALTQSNLQTEVELLHINSKSLNANAFRVADKPNVFLNKQGVDIGPITTDLISVDADIVLEGTVKRGFRLYICIEGIPCVGVSDDPLQAVVGNGRGRALLNGTVRLGDQDRDCSDYLDAMLKQEEDRLNAPAAPLASAPQPPTAPKPDSSGNLSEKARTAAIIKTIINS